MFSGGLDSLAGAVETARTGASLVLVSHRPVSTLDSRQRRLFNELEKDFRRQLIHIPVWINKQERLGREPTQRTRSFLYTALGAVVAESLKAGGVRFYENGILSLNLPVADEALRARASRTTHPAALHLLHSLCSKVTGREFAVDNLYIFHTKTEVVATLGSNQAAHLIPLTCSCAHPMFKSKTQWHCGKCSQCIDRRFALIAAGLAQHDAETDYFTDVFLGPRKDGPEKSMAIGYVRHGIELSRASDTELASRFNAELSRAVRFEQKRSEVAEKFIAMHKRHGGSVNRVLAQKLAENSDKLVQGTLNESSLLGLVLGRQHLVPAVQPELCLEQTEPEAKEDEDRTSTKNLAALLSVLQKFEAPKQRRSKSRERLAKRDAIIFAAILLALEGAKYCAFLQRHGLRPKWADSNPRAENYPNNYKVGHL